MNLEIQHVKVHVSSLNKAKDFYVTKLFNQPKKYVWLGTSPNTRAEKFYGKMGWKKNGMYGNEVKFEMSDLEWKELAEQVAKAI